MRSVAIVSNTSWYIYNFRKGLIKRLVDLHYQVYAIAPKDQFVPELEALGCTFIELKHISNKGKNPFQDLQLLLELKKHFAQHHIGFCLFFTPKINIYGSFATKFTKRQSIATINGLGFVFNDDQPKWLKWVVKNLYTVAFLHLKAVFFQNEDDRQFFTQAGIVQPKQQVRVLRGSGVNLVEFNHKTHFNASNQLVFLLSARLLKEKGIYEYFEAAKNVQQRYPGTQFLLVGLPANNPSAIPQEVINQYHQQGIIQYLGKSDNMNAVLESIDVLVLPSYYREGVPKILIEGLSKGIPIITTQNVGCKETVDDGINGYLIPVKDVAALEAAMIKIIEMPAEERLAMGQASRNKAVAEFDETINHNHYIEFINAYFGNP